MTEKQVVKSGEFELDIVSVQNMVKEYQTLTLVPDDPKSYKVCRTALTACVRVRTGIDKRRLELNADAQKKIKGRNSLAKDLAGLVAPAEDHLSGLVKGEDARKAAIEAEKERLENVKIQGWIDALFKVGVNIEWFTVATMTDEDFNTLYSTARTNYEEEQKRIAAAIKAEEEAEVAARIAAEKEKERLAEVAKAQKVESDRLQKIADEQAETAAKLKAAQDKIDAENAKADEKRRQYRLGRLSGAVWNGHAAIDNETNIIIIPLYGLINMTDKAFDEVARKHNDIFAKREADKEAKAKAQAEADAKDEAERATEAEEKAKLEAERQKELVPDKEKLLLFADKIKDLTAGNLSVESEGARELFHDTLTAIMKIETSLRTEIERI